MPARPPHPCAEPGCPALVADGSRCPKHRRPPWSRNKGRSAASRGYDGAWRELRLLVLQEEPYCRGLDGIRCGAPATDADHIVPLSRRPDLRLARSNLQALCRRCHRLKTGRDGARAKQHT